MTEETKLKNKVMSYLKTVPGLYARKISDRYNSGYPDIWGCYDGKFFAIELKSRRGMVAALQQYELDEMRVCGGISGVCRSIEDVRELLRRAL